jgi:hypothetical protein
MDGTWIDRLARRLAAEPPSRRGLARLGFGAALAVLGLGSELAAAACRGPMKPCSKGRQCCSRRCRKGRCAACAGGGAPCAVGCCPPGFTCRNGGCFRPCADDDACVTCGGPDCACEFVDSLCVDAETSIGVCFSDADCPTGALCSSFRNGDGRQLCTQPCPGCAGG